MDLHVAKVDCVYISSVASQDFTDSLVHGLYGLLNCSIYLARTLNDAFGLNVCYNEVSCFGVDRWLAMLGAYCKYDTACLVADLGSAVTIDLVGQDGSHFGGVISPGIMKMLQSLANCSLLPSLGYSNLIKYSDKLFYCNTQDAIKNGVLLSVSSLLNNQANSANKSIDGSLKMLITGGDAELVRPLLTDDWIIEPTLVFEGMLLLSKDNNNLTKVH
jgi:type III pantothenate kinase